MNILEQYDQSLIFLSEPETNDNENYFIVILHIMIPHLLFKQTAYVIHLRK